MMPNAHGKTSSRIPASPLRFSAIKKPPPMQGPLISEADRQAPRGSSKAGRKDSSGASDVHDVTTSIPRSVVTVVVLDVPVGASCR